MVQMVSPAAHDCNFCQQLDRTPRNGLNLSQSSGFRFMLHNLLLSREVDFGSILLQDSGWQDVHEIWLNMHLLTLASRLATCQMNAGSQIHHCFFLSAIIMYHPSSASLWSSCNQHTDSCLCFSDFVELEHAVSRKRKDHPWKGKWQITTFSHKSSCLATCMGNYHIVYIYLLLHRCNSGEEILGCSLWTNKPWFFPLKPHCSKAKSSQRPSQNDKLRPSDSNHFKTGKFLKKDVHVLPSWHRW